MGRRGVVVGAALAVLSLVATVILVLADDEGGNGPGSASPTSIFATSATASVADTPSASPPASPATRAFPVVGDPVSYGQTHHGYAATDIFAPCGATYLAPYPGTVHEVNRLDEYDPALNVGATRGGLSVSILGDDGVRYYGSHFSAINDAIQPGARVAAGDPVATVGMTGDAGACHVHFGLSLVCSDGDWFVRRGVIWPWPYLDDWRAGGNADPRPELAQWRATAGCPEHPLVEP